MAKGGIVGANTSPSGEIVREVVGPPLNAAAEGDYVVEQTIRAKFTAKDASTNNAVAVKNPHDVDCLITGIYGRVRTAGDSSAAIEFGLVTSSSKTSAKLSSSGDLATAGIVTYYEGTTAAGSANALWRGAANSSAMWLTGRVVQDSATGADAEFYIRFIPLYSTT